MVLSGLALFLALGGCAAGLDWTGAGLDGAAAALVLDRFGHVLELGAVGGVEEAGVLALDGGQCAGATLVLPAAAVGLG